jgi:O-antigen ligase
MGYLFLLLYLGVMYVRPGDMFVSLQGLPILDTIAAATLIFTLLGMLTGRVRWMRAPQHIFILLFAGAIVLSQLQTLYFGGAWAAFREFLVNLLLYFFIVLLLPTEQRFRRFVTWFLLLTAFLAVDGIREHLVGIGWGGQEPIHGRIQGFGIFHDPNDLALALVVAVPLAWDRLRAAKVFGKLLWLPLLGLLFTALILTRSRGGLVALVLVVLFEFGTRRHWFRGLLMVAIAGACFYFYNASRIEETGMEDESTVGRLEAWSEGLQMFKASPLFGVGYGGFLDYHELTAHNSFVLALAELGVAGALPWVALVYSTLRGLFLVVSRRAPPPGAPPAWAASLLAALIGYLAAAFFLSRLYNVVPYILFGMATRVVPLAGGEAAMQRLRFRGKDAFAVFVIFCSLIVLVYLLIKVLAR